MYNEIPKGKRYLLISADATEEQARVVFIRKFNESPQQVLRLYANREWWVGPLPNQTKKVKHGYR